MNKAWRERCNETFVVASLPNGEWRPTNVELYVAGADLSAEDVGGCLDHTTPGLMVALCSSQPQLYNRPKWTGAHRATDGLVVFEACHRLLATTFMRFNASYTNGALRETSLLAAKACVVHASPLAIGGRRRSDG